MSLFLKLKLRVSINSVSGSEDPGMQTIVAFAARKFKDGRWPAGLDLIMGATAVVKTPALVARLLF